MRETGFYNSGNRCYATSTTTRAVLLFYLTHFPELEEEERRKRALQLQQHENKCYYLKLDPAITPMFPQYPEFFFDPASSQWHQMPPAYPEIEVDWGYPAMAVLPLKVSHRSNH